MDRKTAIVVPVSAIFCENLEFYTMTIASFSIYITPPLPTAELAVAVRFSIVTYVVKPIADITAAFVDELQLLTVMSLNSLRLPTFPA